MKKLFIFLLSSVVMLSACKDNNNDDDDNVNPPTTYSYTMGDFATMGSSFTMNVDTSIENTVSIGGTGQNQTWDFSFLTSDETYPASFKDPTMFPEADTAFPNANVVMDLDDDSYIFAEINTNGFHAHGMYMPNPPDHIIIVFAEPITYMPFPITYGMSNIDSSQAESFGDMGGTQTKSVMKLKVKVDVDGEGDITTPLGTFHCLRVKRETYTEYNLYSWDEGSQTWTLNYTDSDTEYSYNFLTKEKEWILMDVFMDDSESIIEEIEFL